MIDCIKNINYKGPGRGGLVSDIGFSRSVISQFQLRNPKNIANMDLSIEISPFQKQNIAVSQPKYRRF